MRRELLVVHGLARLGFSEKQHLEARGACWRVTRGIGGAVRRTPRVSQRRSETGAGPSAEHSVWGGSR